MVLQRMEGKSLLDPASPHAMSAQSVGADGDMISLSAPLSRQTLGHATWSFLHTMAAIFPLEPTPLEQLSAVQLISSLGQVYPCHTCSRHFRLYLSTHPLPAAEDVSRDVLVQWLCTAHNNVNVRLEKPTVDCSKLVEKWPPKLNNACGCDDNEGAESGAGTGGAGAGEGAPVVASLDNSHHEIVQQIPQRRVPDGVGPVGPATVLPT
jgi:hypothetical protein